MEATEVDKGEKLQRLKKVPTVFTLPESRVFVFVTLGPESKSEILREKYFSAALCFLSLLCHNSRRVWRSGACRSLGDQLPPTRGGGRNWRQELTTSSAMPPSHTEARKINCGFGSLHVQSETRHTSITQIHWRLCSAPTQARQYVCIFALQMSSRTRRHVAPREAPSPPQHERKRQWERAARSC